MGPAEYGEGPAMDSLAEIPELDDESIERSMPFTTLHVDGVKLHLLHTAGARARLTYFYFISRYDNGLFHVFPGGDVQRVSRSPHAQLFALGDVALLFGESPVVFAKARESH